jgi:uncharacterized protein (DUF1330 family)
MIVRLYACQGINGGAVGLGETARVPKAYLIADMDVTDPNAYEDYKRLAGPAVERYGGRYIARGGATVLLEGEREPHRTVIIEFPSVDAATTFYSSPEYREARDARAGAAQASIVVVEGMPDET